ncbi:MAG: SURF1 family protein [Comamonas sp.]
MNAARAPAGRLRWLLVTIAALVALAVTASLGFWQLRRAAEKEQWQAQLDAQAALPALDGRSLAAGAGDPAALLHRRVVVQGEWLAGHTVFLDNRQMQGRPGFYVVTPLRLAGTPVAGSATVVLVQRGWVPRNFEDRNALPAVPTPAGPVQLAGRVADQPSRLWEFSSAGEGNEGAGASPIRQNLHVDAFAREIGQRLSPFTVVQTDAAADGLLRDWPVVGTGVEKHYGYAFQWFGLCGLIAILYVWFQIVRRILRRRRHPGA